jgi:hypothetical protein
VVDSDFVDFAGFRFGFGAASSAAAFGAAGFAAIFAFASRVATTIVKWCERFRIRNARPIGAGEMRFVIGPPLTKTSFTNIVEVSTRPA